MSLPFNSDSRKPIERRMSLRLSTVNQRLMDSWMRRADSPAQMSDTREQRQQAINKCKSSNQNHRTNRAGVTCIRSTKDQSHKLIGSYKLQGFKFLELNQTDKHYSKIDSNILDCNGNKDVASEHLDYSRRENDNNNSNISSIDSFEGDGQDKANYDLSDSSEHHFKLSANGFDLNRKQGRRLTRTPELLSKRIKSTCNNPVESQRIDQLICMCGNGSIEAPESSTPSYGVKNTVIYDSYIDKSLLQVNNRNRILIQPHKLVSLSERNGRSMCNIHMPWFGIDIGGSLVKVVFFDPKDATKEESITLKRIRRYLKSSKAYGTTGKRDDHLEMPNCIINKRAGTLHFIRFASNQMPDFLTMAKNKRFADTINNVCATGGGANKFEEDIRTNLSITLHKTDELDSIIHGIHFIDKYNSERECYFLKDPLDDDKCVKVPYDFSRPYPYLVVNIGSGVSILAVYSSTSYSRISGSSIGGGTFLGLCCLLTQCKTFDEAIRLANNGSSTKIDKLVKDIYGGDYPKFNLSGDTVASSFGHMNVADKRKGVKREDLARALLEMVTINIGSISRMCAVNENIDRVVFIGNFLRVNQLSMKLLSYAVNYWSKGAIKALFLEHEGYFGAVGCLVESAQGCCHK